MDIFAEHKTAVNTKASALGDESLTKAQDKSSPEQNTEDNDDVRNLQPATIADRKSVV